ncbi:MAG: cache domain-containing protein [Chloroflexi bacterium]|nr:cache domain-containing protein [Chloroflexota bacterium]MCL5274288.1 cache domain-containing protein [Chloroflexota bacterium]
MKANIDLARMREIRIPIATELILSFSLIIAISSVVFIVAGIQLIGNRIVEEAQEHVRMDLNSARAIYQSRLDHIYDVVRLTADRYRLRDAVMTGNIQPVTYELEQVAQKDHLDVLTVTDRSSKVLLRTSNPDVRGDDRSQDVMVRAVFERKEAVESTGIVSVEDLRKESPALAEQAYFRFVDTPRARPRTETEQTSGMMLRAAAPILDDQNNLLGVIYGGVLLNRNFEIVDKIKQTVFQSEQYNGKDLGTATIFQDDVRISTNVRNLDGSRALGTRLAEDVYNQVVKAGQPWIGRAFVVNDWYITAYEPIRNIDDDIIGILYVGILEQKYVDIRAQTVLVFMTITLGGVLVASVLSYYVSRRISRAIRQLVTASEAIMHGNLNARADVRSRDELRDLSNAFNAMACALHDRDEQLKQFAMKRIMESERLALIGQLAANVAHELNNPLQGIVTYSHLLLERMPSQDTSRLFIQKIVNQADRSRSIIRGLLDFSRHRTPNRQPSDVNKVLQECVALVEDQASFHNIELIKDLHDGLPPVIIDPAQIQQVFINMLINAAEAMQNGGRLALSTHFEPTERFVQVDFADTGHGITAENMERIFDPFFSTKETGHGVGLGLAISYGIIKEHQGTISVQSEVGKGTTFTIQLPVAEGAEIGKQDLHH